MRGLDDGLAPTALVQTMIDEHMQPAVAHAIVDAFVNARRDGRGRAARHAGRRRRRARSSFARRRSSPPGPRCRPPTAPCRVLARGDEPDARAARRAVMSPDECAAAHRARAPAPRPVHGRRSADRARTSSPGYRNSLGMFFRLGETELVRAPRPPLRRGDEPPRRERRGAAGALLRTGRRDRAALRLRRAHERGQPVLGRAQRPAPQHAARLSHRRRGGRRDRIPARRMVASSRGAETRSTSSRATSRGQLDPQSLHAGQPVLRGEKWVVTKWMRQRRFVPRA